MARTCWNGTRVADKDIVKGYEYSKGQYVLLDPDQIEQIKLPSGGELELGHFVAVEDISVVRLARPYFVVPDGKNAKEVIMSSRMRCA